MQASTVILKNESGTSIVQIPSVATFKLKPNDNNVFVLSNYEDGICASIDILYIVFSIWMYMFNSS